MSHETVTWLNRIGIILGFFSFWFAAPEFIGEERLKSWEDGLSKVARRMPNVLRRIIQFFIWILALGIGAAIMWPFAGGEYSNLLIWIIFPVVMTVLICGFLFYYSKIDPLIERVTLKVVSTLANDRKARQRSLFLGAFLFVVSTVLQFLATYEKIK
jgi:hypothetical protein